MKPIEEQSLHEVDKEILLLAYQKLKEENNRLLRLNNELESKLMIKERSKRYGNGK